MARALVAPSGTACRAPTGESATPNRTISRYAEDLGSRRIAASAQAGMPVLLKGKRAGRMPALQRKKRQGNGAGPAEFERDANCAPEASGTNCYGCYSAGGALGCGGAGGALGCGGGDGGAGGALGSGDAGGAGCASGAASGSGAACCDCGVGRSVMLMPRLAFTSTVRCMSSWSRGMEFSPP